jgi:hypothetical protein
MFKNHPRKNEIKFVVQPILREVMNTCNDIPRSVAEITTTYSKGAAICEGIVFDFSLLFNFGIPDLWPVFTLATFSQ